MDENGLITEVYGRKLLGAKLRQGTAQHLYLPGPRRVECTGAQGEQGNHPL